MAAPLHARLNHKLPIFQTRSASEEHPRTWTDGALLSGHEAFTQIRSPPCIEHRCSCCSGCWKSAFVMSVSSNSWDKESIDPDCLVWICLVCDLRVAGQQNHEACEIISCDSPSNVLVVLLLIVHYHCFHHWHGDCPLITDSFRLFLSFLFCCICIRGLWKLVLTYTSSGWSLPLTLSVSWTLDDLLFVVVKMHPYVRNGTQQKRFGPTIWQKCKICAVTTVTHKHISATHLLHDLNGC